MNKNMVVHGRQSIKNLWFVGLKAVLDYFSECMKLGEKVRIVIEYDPQVEDTTITYYRASESSAPQHEIVGKPLVFASEDNDRLILTTVGGKEAITLPKKEAIALGKIIIEQSQSLNERRD
ncbi:MAG: hypothetical protein Q4E13_10445 [Clostridia bacterium]|nr:hypothetical protein [Clostridia bacterium]